MRTPALVALCAALAGCGSSGGAAPTDRDPNTIDADEVGRRDVRRVEEMLRGQVAGVTVRQGPNGLVVQIRGQSTFESSDSPLFVIDGLPIEAGPGGALDGINPADVESIRVLKNVSETAAYGSRGANGVVLITTVRPPRPEAP